MAKCTFLKLCFNKQPNEQNLMLTTRYPAMGRYLYVTKTKRSLLYYYGLSMTASGLTSYKTVLLCSFQILSILKSVAPTEVTKVLHQVEVSLLLHYIQAFQP